jgi:predicted phosphodiesterase
MRRFDRHPTLDKDRLMREGFAVVTDIHANLHNLRRLKAYLKRHNIETVICLGDLVGYGKDPEQVIEESRSFITIAGNHDRGVVYADKLSRRSRRDDDLEGFVSSYSRQIAEERNPERRSRLIDSMKAGYLQRSGGTSDEARRNMEEFLAHFGRNARLSVEWTKQQLSPTAIARLAALRKPFYVDNMLFVHATPQLGSYDYAITLAQADEVFNEYLEIGDICFMGHSHMPVAHIGVPKGRHHTKFEEEFGYYITEERGFDEETVMALNGRRLAARKQPVPLKDGYKYLIKCGVIGTPRDGYKQPCFIYVKDNSFRYVNLRI